MPINPYSQFADPVVNIDVSGAINKAGTYLSNDAGFAKFGTGDISTMISGAFDFALSLGAILAVMRITYAGWLYMGWSDSVSEKTSAKETLNDAIFGLILLFGIWVILFQINPCLLTIRIFAGAEKSANCDDVKASAQK